ncbi:MAG: ABC transporter ATP-binding protein [Candidatus Lambdaproteobacteria bacterium]|nr:ABC transporter ATP-binding protein [Candidatus Lambdaproteobacteria bacterium]
MEAVALTKSYASRAGTYPVLAGVTLALAPGEFVGVLGPSGGGKSTLLNILAGLEPPDGGQVRIHGRPPGARPPIAYMQQKDLLLPWRTLWDNVLLGPELESPHDRVRLEPKARELVRQFRLEGFADHYPAQLSGGMRQRTALIRTLLCERNILLLDEPFGALDALTRRRLHRHLLRVWREFGQTVLLVTHDVEEAIALSTRIVVLSARPGRIVDVFPLDVPHELRERTGETLRLKQRILEVLEGDDDA